MSSSFSFTPIGIVHSPDKRTDLGPLTDEERGERTAEIEIYEEYAEGLKDIEKFSHLYILFVFHASRDGHLIAHPPPDGKPRGVFASRSPHRPNPLGLTVVRLVKKEGRFLTVKGVDMLDKTPILDIKPYTGADMYPEAKGGFGGRNLKNRKSKP